MTADTYIFSLQFGRTPLHHASDNNQLEVMRLLWESGAKSSVNDSDLGGNIPLHLASQKGFLEVVSFLGSVGSQLNAVNNDGDTPVQMAINNDHKKLVKFIEEKAAIKNFELWKAAEVGDIKKLTELLHLDDASIDHKDWEDSTPLHRACKSGEGDVVDFLLSNGARVDYEDLAGKTPLHIASSKGYIEIVSHLLAKGAKVNTECKRGKTPLDEACEMAEFAVVCFLLGKGATVKSKEKFAQEILEKATQQKKVLLKSGDMERWSE